jgi:3-oxoacyl-[acyl-carrier protein] reductase
MDLGLKGKVALVTGAGRGIGAATAKALAAHGARVAINYLCGQETADDVLKEVRQQGGTAMLACADVRDRAAVNAMVQSVAKELGGIDILVNNANISFPVKAFADFGWEEFEAKLMGEMKALVNCSQAVLPSMLAKKAGKLILVSSSLSRSPAFGFSAHAAAKGAMDSMAKVMAAELGPQGVTVNVIGPGLTLTDATKHQPREMHEQIASFTPLRRLGLPDDVAGVAVFLASRLSDYVNGQYIPVNGGMFMV